MQSKEKAFLEGHLALFYQLESSQVNVTIEKRFP